MTLTEGLEAMRKKFPGRDVCCDEYHWFHPRGENGGTYRHFFTAFVMDDKNPTRSEAGTIEQAVADCALPEPAAEAKEGV